MDKNLAFALDSIIGAKSLNQSFRDSVKKAKEDREESEKTEQEKQLDKVLKI